MSFLRLIIILFSLFNIILNYYLSDERKESLENLINDQMNLARLKTFGIIIYDSNGLIYKNNHLAWRRGGYFLSLCKARWRAKLILRSSKRQPEFRMYSHRPPPFGSGNHPRSSTAHEHYNLFSPTIQLLFRFFICFYLISTASDRCNICRLYIAVFLSAERRVVYYSFQVLFCCHLCCCKNYSYRSSFSPKPKQSFFIFSLKVSRCVERRSHIGK